MSNRWPAGIIRKTPVTPAGPLQSGAASGVWSLADAAYWTKQGLWPLAGNILAVEDVFSTWLYTGNGSTQTITNGINLSGQGGMVWVKNRSVSSDHRVIDSERKFNATNSYALSTNTTGAQGIAGFYFNTNGFVVDTNGPDYNTNGQNYASWTFREAPNFFDVVTYTGNGVAGRMIPHSLGSVPGMIIVKQVNDSSENWQVWHRSLPATDILQLNVTTAAVSSSAFNSGDTQQTATDFTVSASPRTNGTGINYVAYLYAHNTASTGIIQCGGYTVPAGATSYDVNIGWEPQWMLVKRANGGGGWTMLDNMRGWPQGQSVGAGLSANTSDAEFNTAKPNITPTGFSVNDFNSFGTPGNAFVYMAIRRGPMKTPTLGTSVFLPLATSLAVDTAITTNFPVDLMISGQRNSNPATDNWAFIDRLRGATASTNTQGSVQKRIKSTSTNLEDSPTYPYAYNWWNTGLVQGYGLAGASQIYYTLRRAPGFFDEVCYTGTGVATAYNHNLGVVPELIIIKNRGANGAWLTYCAQLAPPNDKYLLLNLNNAPSTVAGTWKTPTSTTFGMDISFNEINASGNTYVAYLFASCPGVSKVGSYTGNGSSQTINCAFTTGSRFVMIKRTDSTGDWYVWDSARGIVAGNDPYLALNDISAEVTTNDSVDTDNTGFIVNQVAASNVNVNAATYIFLAIA
jgi:hypothetical protein